MNQPTLDFFRNNYSRKVQKDIFGMPSATHTRKVFRGLCSIYNWLERRWLIEYKNLRSELHLYPKEFSLLGFPNTFKFFSDFIRGLEPITTIKKEKDWIYSEMVYWRKRLDKVLESENPIII